MAIVTVSINGRSYEMACADGQEPHLRALAAEMDRRTSDLQRAVGQAGDARLLAMVGMVLVDELTELRAAQAAIPEPEPVPLVAETVPGIEPSDIEALDLLMAEGIDSLTRRLDTIAQTLEKP